MLNDLAAMLNQARETASPIAQISLEIKDFLRPDAYQIQELQFKMRETKGETQVGWKMGLTSEAKRKQMNLDSPLYGFLTNKMQVICDGVFNMTGSIHPKIEPEVAFLISKDLTASPTRDEVLNSCSAVCAALEILDSRYQQFKYFSMEDVISDNSSSSHFVLGPWLKDFKNLDITNLKMQMFADGALAEAGNSKDISGDPVLSVIQLCKLLAERKQTLKAGSIVLAGAATAAVALKEGLNVKLSVDGLEEVSVSITKN